jgi:thioesterase domain-containing protein
MFITEMKKVQPKGPYYIGGCFASGLVALEMARQLTQQGEEIALLAEIDTVPRFRSIAQRAQGKFLKVLRAGPSKWWEIIESLRDRDYVEGTQHIIWKAAVKFTKATGYPLPFLLRTGIYEEFMVRRATNNYTPATRYTGSIALFLTPGWHAAFSARPQWGWGEMMEGEPQVYEIPGDPCTVFTDENVPKLGVQLKKLLAEARKPYQPG